MGKNLRLMLLLLPALCTAACTSRGGATVLFAVDSFWYASGYFTEKKVRELETAAAEYGARLEIEPVPYGNSGLAVLLAAAAEGRAETVLLSPFLTAEFSPDMVEGSMKGADADNLPENRVNIVGISATPRGNGPEEHLGMIGISREKALRELGRELCGYVRKTDAPGVTGFWHTGSEGGKQDYETFYRAFTEDCAPELCTITLLDRADAGTAENSLRGFTPEEGMVALAFTGQQNGEYVRRFAEEGTGIASEYLFLDDFPETAPVFSIDLPMNEIIRSAVENPPEIGKKTMVDAVLLKRE